MPGTEFTLKANADTSSYVSGMKSVSSSTQEAEGRIRSFGNTASMMGRNVSKYASEANRYAQIYTRMSSFAPNNYEYQAAQARNLANAIGQIVTQQQIASAQQTLADPSTSLLDKAKAAELLANEYSKLQPKAQQASDAIRKVGDEAQKSSAKASSSAKGGFANLWSSLLRIAKLRFLRGIIRGITSSFREGITNIYQYSQAMNSTDASNFSNSMNELASSLNYMKNAIGAAVAPLIAQ